jgi:uncharacterized protein DUF5615
MSRPRFLADHDLNEAIVDGTVRREPLIEFLKSRDIGLHVRPDADVLAWAATQDLIVISHDVNTMPAEAYARVGAGQPLAGLLMVQQSHPVREIIESLVLIWAASEAEEWHGQVRFLPI